MREQVESVSRRALLPEGISLEVHSMDVHLCAKPEGVPRHFVPSAHLQAGQVTVHAPIYGYNSECTPTELRTVQSDESRCQRSSPNPAITMHHIALHEVFIIRID